MADNEAYYDRISHTLSQKMLEEREMNWNVRDLKYQEELIKGEVDVKVQKLNKLQPCLDKLSFANTAYRGNPKATSSSELDAQKLQFRMQHGSNNMAMEKRVLRDHQINSSQKKELVAGTTLDELDAPIKKLNEQMEKSHLNLYRTDFEGIKREIKRHEMGREKAVANAAVGGRLWTSLGSKKDIHQQVKVMYEELEELRAKQIETRNGAKSADKKLRLIQKQIVFLQKQLQNINDVINVYY